MKEIATQSVQVEDALLMVWLVVAQPLMQRLAGNLLAGQSLGSLGPTTPHATLLAAIYLGTALCACVCVGTREATDVGLDADQAMDKPAVFARLPLMSGVLFITLQAFDLLGKSLPDPLFSIGLLFFVATFGLYTHLPRMDAVYRRILITPTIIVGTSIFTATIHDVFGGINGRDLLTGALGGQDQTASFYLFIFAAATAVFYAIFIFAPRQVASSRHSWLQWVARYALYIVGVLLNVAWLASV